MINVIEEFNVHHAVLDGWCMKSSVAEADESMLFQPLGSKTRSL